jgi:hypothetical protein
MGHAALAKSTPAAARAAPAIPALESALGSHSSEALSSAQAPLGRVVLAWSAARRQPGQRQQIAIRVLEPSDFRTGWRSPNAKCVLLRKGIALEHHTFGTERPHDLFKQNHGPAELCVRLWGEGLHLCRLCLVPLHTY